MFLDVAAPVSAERTVHINGSRAGVWDVLADLTAWPSWNPDITELTCEGAIAPGTTFRWKSRGLRIVSMIQVVEANQRIVWTGEAIGTRAIHEWKLTETAGGVEVRTRELFGGWLPKLLPGIVRRELQKSLDTGLQHLKKEVETRETRTA